MKLNIMITIPSFAICLFSTCSSFLTRNEIIEGVFVARLSSTEDTDMGNSARSHEYSLLRFYPDGSIISGLIELADSTTPEKWWLEDISLWFHKEHASQLDDVGKYTLKEGELSILSHGLSVPIPVPVPDAAIGDYNEIDSDIDTHAVVNHIEVIKYLGRYYGDSLIFFAYNPSPIQFGDLPLSDSLKYHRLTMR